MKKILFFIVLFILCRQAQAQSSSTLTIINHSTVKVSLGIIVGHNAGASPCSNGEDNALTIEAGDTWGPVAYTSIPWSIPPEAPFTFDGISPLYLGGCTDVPYSIGTYASTCLLPNTLEYSCGNAHGHMTWTVDNANNAILTIYAN